MGKNRNRPARAIEPFRRASRPGTLQSYYGGKNKRRSANLGCKGASCRGVVGRCHKQMEWAQTFRPLLGSILDKSRPFWGAGQTSPGLSATSWAHLGGRGKQVQAFRPLFGFLGGRGKAFRPLLGPIFGGRGEQVQAFRPLLGPILGSGANKSRFGS